MSKLENYVLLQRQVVHCPLHTSQIWRRQITLGCLVPLQTIPHL